MYTSQNCVLDALRGLAEKTFTDDAPNAPLRQFSFLVKIFSSDEAAGRRCTGVHRAMPTKYGGKRLPGRLLDAGNLSLVGQLAEADTADAEITQVRVRAAADLAAVVSTGRELRLRLLLEDHRLLSHLSFSSLTSQTERPSA